MTDWEEFLASAGYGPDTPEEERAPIRKLWDAFSSAVQRIRGMGEDSSGVRSRLGLPENVPSNPRMMVQPDVTGAAMRLPPSAAPEPMAVLESGGPRTMSDQVRRMDNLDRAAAGDLPSIESSTLMDQVLSNPNVQRARTGIELALDFTPVGIAKDATMAGINALQGDLGDASLYGLATIPFLGTGAKEALDYVQPYHRGAFGQQITDAYFDRWNPRRNLVFAEPGYLTDASYGFGAENMPIKEMMRRLVYNEQVTQNPLLDLPALGFSPTVPEERLRALYELGFLPDPAVRQLRGQIAASFRNLRASGVPDDFLKTYDGVAEVIQNANIDDRFKELLDPANPLFPPSVATHEGRHRSAFAKFLEAEGKGPAAQPMRVVYDDALPLEAIDNPLAFKQVWSQKTPHQLIDAPTTLNRSEQQADIAGRLAGEYGRYDSDFLSEIDAIRAAMPPAERTMPGFRSSYGAPFESFELMRPTNERQLPNIDWDVGQEIKDRAEEARQFYGFTLEPPSPEDFKDVKEFRDYISHVLTGKPYDPNLPINQGRSFYIDPYAPSAGFNLGTPVNDISTNLWSPYQDWVNLNKDLRLMDNNFARRMSRESFDPSDTTR